MKTFQTTYETLYRIYNKHRLQYRENSYDSQQMCLMWSTYDPPDDIEGTESFCDIEKAFEMTNNEIRMISHGEAVPRRANQ